MKNLAIDRQVWFVKARIAAGQTRRVAMSRHRSQPTAATLVNTVVTGK
jgi:hypothetical protein